MSISTARIRRECEGGGFCHEMAYEVCRERDAQAAEIAELRAAISLQKQVAGEAIDAYARVSDQLAELRAKLEAAEKEANHDRLFARTVLSSLHWTGDGYEWTGGRFDYRMQPSEAASLTTSEIESLRSQLTALRTAAAPFEDSRPVDEATIREVLKDDEITTLHYRQGDKQLRIDRKDYSFSFGVMSDGGVFYGPFRIKTIGQLNHLLAALKPGGVK